MTLNDPLDFPPELCSEPAPLVGLCGLDVQNNPLHRTIWEAFSKNLHLKLTQEKPCVNFKLFSLNHAFPPVKPKRTTYDWYIPKGLLKRNWMRKRLLEIPAVAALMFDWDDANADQLRLDCASQIQILRASLGSHTTKIVVILVQKVAPLPDDTKASEKARLLCSACDIDTKQLYVLPHGETLQGYIDRLEIALHELAQHYYNYEIKLVKQHKDKLNKTTQQYLFVRYQFKLGFLYELKQDSHVAKKFYDSAYTFLKDVRISDTNIFEVKLIAGFIAYKRCYLMFRMNQPRDAITNFKYHIELYKNKTASNTDLLFEHYSWLSKQYSGFGDIFDDAVRRGLFPVQTEHPGFYYRLAAKYAIDRKLACLKVCSNVTSYPSSDPLMGISSLEFYGQRPWRPGQLSAEPVNVTLEQEGIAALKYREKLVNHSSIIISLLGNAISQFKTYRCPRMRLELVVQMADEYMYSQDYGKALTLYSHIIWDYKDEKWWMLLSVLLAKALSCAYMAASWQDYIIFSLEGLGLLVKFDLEKRKKIFNNLMAVLQMKTPEPEPEISASCVAQANALWEAKCSEQLQSAKVDMSYVNSCIEIKARFLKSVYKIGETVVVEVYIRSYCPYPLEVSRLSVVISSSSHSSEFILSSDKEGLTFEPGVFKKFSVCEFQCDPSDVNKTIQIESILLTLGSLEKGRSAVLKFSSITAESNGAIIEKQTDDFQYFRLKISDPVFDRVESRCLAKIVSEINVKITINHEAPALLSEWYPVEINILNEENSEIYDLVLDIKTQPSHEDVGGEHSTQLCADIKNCALQSPISSLSLPLKDISQNASEKVVVYLKGLRVGERVLFMKLNYSLSKDVGPLAKLYVKKIIRVPIIQPFDMSSEILSMKFEQIQKCFAKYPFILSPRIRILSPWPIKIHHSTLELGKGVKSCDETMTSDLANTVLNEGEYGTDMFPLVVEEASEQPLALGTYLLKWSRVNNSEVTNSSVTMPAIICEATVVGVDINLPAYGWVRKPMKVEYSLCNHTNDLLELNLFMEASDNFMFAGQKQVSLRLLPGSTKTIEYHFYPLLSGFVALPRLIFRNSTEEFTKKLNQILDKNFSSHIYIMPQEK